MIHRSQISQIILVKCTEEKLMRAEKNEGNKNTLNGSVTLSLNFVSGN